MGWFKKKRYSDYTVDLTRFRKKDAVKTEEASTATDSSDISTGFLGDLAASSEAAGDSSSSISSGASDFSERIDILSNRIYKLMERIELLERKLERLERRNSY